MNSTLHKLSLAALVALPLLHACGGSSSGSGSSSVRLVNASADFPTLDLVGPTGAALSAGVASFSAGSYGGVDAGTQMLSLKPTGSVSAAATGSYALGKDTSYSVVSYVANGVLTGSLITESETAPTAGTAKLRIFNTVYNRAVPNDADKLDVYVVTSNCADLASSSVAAVSSAVTALGAFTEIGAVAAGTPYHVCVTGASDRSDLRLDLPAVTLKDQQVTTLVLTSTPGGVLVNGVQIDQQGTVTSRRNLSARVRLVADAALGGTVSADVGGTTLAPAAGPLPSPRVGSYVLVPVGTGGTLATSVRINGGPAVAGSVSATPGTDLTLLVAGTAAAPVVKPIADDNRPSTNAALPVKVRVVNGINGLPAGSGVDLSVNNAPAASNVLFGNASTPFSTVAATAAAATGLEVTSATSVLVNGTPPATTSVFKASGTDAVLRAGKVYTVFVLGDVTNTVSLLRQDH